MGKAMNQPKAINSGQSSQTMVTIVCQGFHNNNGLRSVLMEAMNREKHANDTTSLSRN
jgi:uncharacterized membrane protein